MDNEYPLILWLNDDCLWSIFSYLKLPDLLVAEKVCRRFRGIVQRHYCKQSRNVDFFELARYYWSIHKKPVGRFQECKEALAMKLGPYVQALMIAGEYDMEFLPISPIVEFLNRPSFKNLPMSVLEHFHNLQYICLKGYYFRNENCIRILPEILPALKYIELIDLSFDEKLLANLLKKLPKLEVLKIRCGYFSRGEFTGECLLELTGIEELLISGYFDFARVNGNYFAKFCENNPQLRKLCINMQIQTYDNQNVQSIGENLKKLENLILTEGLLRNNAIIYAMLSNLSNLKRLRIDIDMRLVYRREMDAFVEAFVEKITKKNHIECLNITYQEGCKEILKHFKHLKVLVLNMCISDFCSRLSDDILPILYCLVNLEEIHLISPIGYSKLTSADLKALIQNLKCLKLINFLNFNKFDISFLLDIEECLLKRNQILEFIVNQTPIEKELLKKEEKCKLLQGFIERTRGKVKLTIQPKRSFHEWEEWEIVSITDKQIVRRC